MWRAVLVVVGMGFLAFAASLLDPPHASSAGQRAVEFATLDCATNRQSVSMGYVVDDRTVVTVAHALHLSRDHAVRDAFGTWHRADDIEIVRLDLERDLAVLRIADLRATAAPENAAARSVGDWADTPVRMLSARDGDIDATIVRRVRIETQVIGDRETTSKRSGYEVDLEIAPGDSGAALVDASDRLVALVFARSTRSDGRTWATATDEIDFSSEVLPTWDCGPDSGARLELTPREPARLAS